MPACRSGCCFSSEPGTRPERDIEPSNYSMISRVFASSGSWALVLGATGFICGFFGPMLLSPDANQEPMLGLFITGPGGAIVGAVLGFIVRAVRLPTSVARKALVAVAGAYALTCLYFSTPEPAFYATVLDAEIVSCAPPATMKDQAFEEWEQRIERVTGAPPRAGWKEDFERMVAADPGVVLELRVMRSRKLYENRKPWNRGTFFSWPWETRADTPTRYFARFSGASCAGYSSPRPALLLATGQTSKLWPSEL